MHNKTQVCHLRGIHLTSSYQNMNIVFIDFKVRGIHDSWVYHFDHYHLSIKKSKLHPYAEN